MDRRPSLVAALGKDVLGAHALLVVQRTHLHSFGNDRAVQRDQFEN